jgi:hypothetical protein
MILRFDPLEGRQLLSASKPDLVASQFTTVHVASWGGQIEAIGTISNKGGAATRVPVQVQIYASSKPSVADPTAVTRLLGTVTVPAGLAPGATSNFDQIVTLPSNSTTATPTTTSQTIYASLLVDPTNAAKERTLTNKAGRGIGLDASPIVVSLPMPADLEGTAFSIAAVNTSKPGVYSWGDTFDVTEQIKNVGQGNAPPTRARIVLTPLGGTPGAYSDVTIGNINVPAIPAFQSANVVQRVTLPPLEPLTLGNATQFTVSVVQDGDFVTQPVYPRIADQGPGLDQGQLGINPGPLALVPQGPTADIAPSTVLVSQSSLYWGQQFQVSAEVQNVANVPAGPFTVRFVAAGASGDVSHGIFLGDVQVPGLAANGSTNVLTTVQLPARLPYGDKIASPAYSQIYAIADPEDVVNESLRTNNMASSAPVLLQVVGTEGTNTTVPTYPANVYTNPALSLQAAKQAAQNQKVNLGTPKPASVTKKHKVDFLAGLSESITKWTVNEVKGIPKGVNNILKNLGASGGSNSQTAATPSNAQAATTATAAPANVIGSPTSGGTGGFGATPI